MLNDTAENVNHRRYAAVLEYDGAPYCGWQRQKGQHSVQAAVETALSRVADEPISVITAGRTDTGVHASAQVIHFDTSKARADHEWLRGSNTFLEPAIAILAVKPVTKDFHARFSARGRKYRYIILNRPARPGLLRTKVSWIYYPLAEQRMRQAASGLVGRHNFNAYRSSKCQAHSPVREIKKLKLNRQGDWLWMDIEADGFLHHMVRNIAGVLLAIGRGEQEPGWANEVLQGQDRTKAGLTAPAGGLYLTGVDYPPEFAIPLPPCPVRFW